MIVSLIYNNGILKWTLRGKEILVDSKKKKKIIYLIVIPAFILLVLSVIFYTYINSESFRENMKSILITQLENNLGKNIEIEIGTIDSISFQSLHLTHFTVLENGFDNKDNIIFQAEQAKAGFAFLFSLFQWKDWQLDIQDITFYRASASLTRESTGEFDFIKKLDLGLEKLQQNLMIQRIHFQDSQLIYHDELVYNYNLDYLTTRANNINGYFDLSQLPEIVFDFKGIQEKDHALLALSGHFLTNQIEYSLDFHLENADITHFQYYLEVAEQFNITRGQFEIDFNLSFSPDLDPIDIYWKGNANFQQVDAKPQFLNQIAFQQISGSVQFANPEIMVSKLTGFYHDRPVYLKGLVLAEPEVYFDLDITSEGVNASQLKNDVSLFVPDYTDFSLQGKLDLTGNIKGQPEDFQIESKLFSSEIFIEDIPFQKIDCSFLLHHEELIIHSLEANDPQASFMISGQVDWSEDIPFYHFSLQTESLSLQHPLFNKLSFFEDSSGNINSHFLIESQRQDNSILNIEGQFNVKSIKIEDFSLLNPLEGNIRSTIDFSDTLLTIEQCELESGQNHGFLKGKIYFDEFVHYTLDFGYQVPELSELASSLGLEVQTAGRANIEGTFYGNSQQPEIEAEFNLQEFSIEDNLLGELTGELIYQQDVISLGALILTNQNIKLTGNGKVILHESGLPEIELSYQLPAIDLDPFIQTMTDNNIPLSCQTTGTGQIQGIWPELAVRGNFQLNQVTYQDYLLGQGNFEFNLQPEQDLLTENKDSNFIELFDWLGHSYSLELNNFILQNETLQLTAEGQYKIGKNNPFALEISFSHQSLDEMIDIFYPGESYFKIFLPSQITGKANLKGDISEQHITLSAQLIPQEQENTSLSQLESVIIRNDEGLLISNFTLIQSEGQFKAEGNISPAEVLDVDFQAEQLDMNMLMSLVQIDEVMQGIMNIEGSCRGTIDQPQISMTAQIERGYFREFKFEDLQSNFHWDSQKNEIEIRKLVIGLEEDYQIQAKGNLPLGAFITGEKKETEPDISDTVYQEIPLDFQINMEKADLNLLRLFWKDAFSELMGNIDLELALAGTTENPIVNGVIDIHRAKVAINHLPIQMEEIDTRIEVLDNQVTIPNIPFTAYENHFNISGQFELIHLVPENMELTIRNDEKKIVYQNIIESEADFLAEISGSLIDPYINGQLILSRGEVNLNHLLQLHEEENISSYTPTTQDTSQSYLDLNIEIADPFSLRLPNAEINVTGNIGLSGSFTEPDVQGNLVLRKGYLIYFEKRFVISEGRVVINGLTVNDIDINAVANTNVQDVQITINVSGKLANPQILLSSQPTLRETEIVSLLAFNRNIQGLSEGEINQLLSQEMVDIIFQSLQINLFKRMERELAEGMGLEFIRFSYDTSENSGSSLFFLEDLHLGDLTLEVGKSISDDLLITYSTPLDFHGDTSLGVEYQISSDFTLSTQFDTYSLKEEDYRFKFGLEIRF